MLEHQGASLNPVVFIQPVPDFVPESRCIVNRVVVAWRKGGRATVTTWIFNGGAVSQVYLCSFRTVT